MNIILCRNIRIRLCREYNEQIIKSPKSQEVSISSVAVTMSASQFGRDLTHSSINCPNVFSTTNMVQCTPPRLNAYLSDSHPVSTHHKSSSNIQKFKKAIWTKEEDDLLQKVVGEKGVGVWKEISTHIPNRTGKQCRERWHNHLRQGVKKQPWSPDQFWILALCVRAQGRKWSIISQYLPDRSDNTIKNIWNCKMKPYKHKFDQEINKLLLDPSSWESLSPLQESLLTQIATARPQSVSFTMGRKQKNRKIEQTMILYERELEEALREFEMINFDEPEDEIKFQLYEQESPEEIRGGECIFEESQDFF